MSSFFIAHHWQECWSVPTGAGRAAGAGSVKLEERELMRIRKHAKKIARTIRETRMFARAMQSDSHPILAQIVPIRRCNLDCTYCNEYDKTFRSGAARNDARRESIAWPISAPPSSR